MKSILYLVIPCYNEQEVLPETSKQLLEKMTNLIKKEKISEESKIMFVRVFVFQETKDTRMHCLQVL